MLYTASAGLLSSPLRFRVLAPVFSAFLLAFGTTAWSAVGLPDYYLIDNQESSETLVVTANDRLEVSTQAAIEYVEIVSVSGLSDPSAGTVQDDPDDGFSVNFFPSGSYTGSVTFTYVVRDIRGSSSPTTVTIELVGGVEGLVANPDNYASNGTAINVFPEENDTWPGEDPTVEIVSQPASGTLSSGGVKGLFIYTPTADVGEGYTDSFDYRLVLGEEVSSTATVTIDVDPSLDPIASRGQDDAQKDLAGVLQIACDANTAGSFGDPDPTLTSTCNTLAALSDSELDGALEEIILRQVGAQAQSMKGAAEATIKNIGSRLQDLRTGSTGLSLSGLNAQLNGENLALGDLIDSYYGKGGAAGEEGSGGRLGVFVTGTLQYGEGESRNRENGFDVDTQELMGGVDYRFTSNLIMGAALGYSTSETTENGGDTQLDVDGWTLSVYGNYYPVQNWYIDWLVGYGESSLETRRVIAIPGLSVNANGDTDGDQLSGALGTGYSFYHEAWTFDAYTSFEYRSATVDGYTETNDAGLDLNIFETTNDKLTGRFGGRASQAISMEFGVLIPQFELELVKDFKSEAPTIEAELALLPEAGSFRVTTEEPDDSYFNAGLSLTGVFKNGTSGFIRYGTNLSRDDVSFDTWQLGARMELGGPSQDINLFQSRENQGVGVGAFLGTTGLGLGLTFPLRNEHLNLRTVIATLPYDTDETLDDVEYEVDIELLSLGVLLDWHPFAGGFRVSGGFYSLQHDISGSANPTSDVDIGNSTFTPEEVGTLNAEIDYSRSFAPYLGVGWGNAVMPDSRLTFSADVGLMFTDNPTVQLSADSPVADANPALRAQLDTELANEEERINREDLEDVKYWPVISFGLAYHF